MKPTQEQIEAALNWLQWLDDDRFGNFEKEPHGARQILRPCKRGDYETLETTSSRILAAAYREKCDECDELKKELRHIANLLDAHFDNGGTVAGLGTTNKARKLLNDKP